MKIHEYQAKAILSKYGVRVPRGEVAYNKEEAREIARRLGFPVVVKAQIHAGGRGKGGGVKLASSADETEEIARKMLGSRLVTHQTGPEGRIVKRVLIEEGLRIQTEFYLGIVIDRAVAKPVFMASRAGGMEIEKVAEETPDLILKEPIDISLGLTPFQARKLAFGLELPPAIVSQAVSFMIALYKAFQDTDASLADP